MKHKCRPITWNKNKDISPKFNSCDLFLQLDKESTITVIIRFIIPTLNTSHIYTFCTV